MHVVEEFSSSAVGMVVVEGRGRGISEPAMLVVSSHEDSAVPILVTTDEGRAREALLTPSFCSNAKLGRGDETAEEIKSGREQRGRRTQGGGSEELKKRTDPESKSHR